MAVAAAADPPIAWCRLPEGIKADLADQANGNIEDCKRLEEALLDSTTITAKGLAEKQDLNTITRNILEDWETQNVGPDCRTKFHSLLLKSKRYKRTAQCMKEDLLGHGDTTDEDDSASAVGGVLDYLTHDSPNAKILFHKDQLTKELKQVIKDKNIFDELINGNHITLDEDSSIEALLDNGTTTDACHGLIRIMVGKDEGSTTAFLNFLMRSHPNLISLLEPPLPPEVDLKALQKKLQKEATASDSWWNVFYKITGPIQERVRQIEQSVKAAMRKAAMKIIGCKECTVVVMGRTGAGKSALVNSLLADKNAAKIGMSVEHVTKKPHVYRRTLEGLDFTIWDTPGLFDSNERGEGYVEHMKVMIKRFHIALFTVECRNAMRLENSDIEVLRMLHTELGTEIFEHMVIVLTKADTVREQVICSRGVGYSAEGSVDDEQRRLITDFTSSLKTTLREKVGIVTTIPILPASWVDFTQKNPVPLAIGLHYPNWYGKLWEECLSKAHPCFGLQAIELARRQERLGTQKKKNNNKRMSEQSVFSQDQSATTPASAADSTRIQPPKQEERGHQALSVRSPHRQPPASLPKPTSLANTRCNVDVAEHPRFFQDVERVRPHTFSGETSNPAGWVTTKHQHRCPMTQPFSHSAQARLNELVLPTTSTNDPGTLVSDSNAHSIMLSSSSSSSERQDLSGCNLPMPEDGFWMKIAIQLQNKGEQLIQESGTSQCKHVAGVLVRGTGRKLARFLKACFS